MNRISGWRVLAVALGVAGVTSGCSVSGNPGVTTGHPPSAPAGPTDPASRLPYAGAPTVTAPLPASALAGDPCSDALTPAQVVAAVGADVAGQREDLAQIGPACAWTNDATGGAVGVSYTINTGVGLSGVYANTRPASAVWRELPKIQGFPAVAHAGTNGSEPPVGFCQASVGLSDTMSIDVSLTLGRSKRDSHDACDLVPQIADMTVTTLTAKAGS